MVHDAECSQGKTLWCHQGHARVKPDMRVFGHQRVGYEPFVGRCVSNDKQVRLQDSMGAKRDVPGRFLDRQTDLRLEPLPLPVDEADQRDRSAANVCGQTGQIVKVFFGSGVKNLVLMKDMKPRLFVPGQWRLTHVEVTFLRPGGLSVPPEIGVPAASRRWP